mgnify:CR=1 FL=1
MAVAPSAPLLRTLLGRSSEYSIIGIQNVADQLPMSLGINYIVTGGNNPMSDLKRTQLYDVHVAAGAAMVDFGGWEMPIEYPTKIVALDGDSGPIAGNDRHLGVVVFDLLVEMGQILVCVGGVDHQQVPGGALRGKPRRTGGPGDPSSGGMPAPVRP